jgi:hypothetical protein
MLERLARILASWHRDPSVILHDDDLDYRASRGCGILAVEVRDAGRRWACRSQYARRRVRER